MEKRDGDFLSPKMVEERYHIKVGTLANWRSQGRGPEYVKLGRKILYPLDGLTEWCRACRVRTIDSLDSANRRL